MIDLSDSLKNIIEELLFTDDWKEGLQLEFKKSNKALPRDAWPTYSAFANTEGGILVLGVDDDGNILGLERPEQIKKELIDTSNNPSKVSYNLIHGDDVILHRTANKTILVVRIRRAPNEMRPVYINDVETNCFRRNGSADQRCTDELRYQMIRDKVLSPSHAKIIPHSTMDDLDLSTINQYRNLMTSVNPTHPWLKESNEGLLRKIGAYARNRETGAEGLTLDGLLMFGTDEALRELLPQYKVEYFEMIDNPTIHQRWLDRVYSDGTWHPNLFQFFHRVRNKLEQNLKRSFSLSANATRQDDSLAHIAIREALANAIVHADYTLSGGVRIEQSSQGIKLRNAGTLLLSKDIILQGGHTKCRNPLLQTMFALIGVSEKAGSGVDKLLRGWLDEYIATPMVQEFVDPIYVEWVLPYASLAQRQQLEHLQQVLGEHEYCSLDFWQKLILLMIPSDGWVSRKELASVIPIHPAELSQYLGKLVKESHVVTQGKSSGTTYQKHSKLLFEPKGSAEDSITSSPDCFDDEFFLSLDSALQERVRVYRTQKRHARTQTDQIILDIAHDRWVSLSTLSKLLYLKASVINRDFVQPLVRNKRMTHRFPQPHPKQEFQTLPEK